MLRPPGDNYGDSYNQRRGPPAQRHPVRQPRYSQYHSTPREPWRAQQQEHHTQSRRSDYDRPVRYEPYPAKRSYRGRGRGRGKYRGRGGGNKRSRSPTNYRPPKRKKWQHPKRKPSRNSHRENSGQPSHISFKLQNFVLASGDPGIQNATHEFLYSAFYDMYLLATFDNPANYLQIVGKSQRGVLFQATLNPHDIYSMDIIEYELPNEDQLERIDRRETLRHNLTQLVSNEKKKDDLIAECNLVLASAQEDQEKEAEEQPVEEAEEQPIEETEVMEVTSTEVAEATEDVISELPAAEEEEAENVMEEEVDEKADAEEVAAKAAEKEKEEADKEKEKAKASLERQKRVKKAELDVKQAELDLLDIKDKKEKIEAELSTLEEEIEAFGKREAEEAAKVAAEEEAAKAAEEEAAKAAAEEEANKKQEEDAMEDVEQITVDTTQQDDEAGEKTTDETMEADVNGQEESAPDAEPESIKESTDAEEMQEPQEQDEYVEPEEAAPAIEEAPEMEVEETEDPHETEEAANDDDEVVIVEDDDEDIEETEADVNEEKPAEEIIDLTAEDVPKEKEEPPALPTRYRILITLKSTFPNKFHVPKMKGLAHVLNDVQVLLLDVDGSSKRYKFLKEFFTNFMNEFKGTLKSGQQEHGKEKYEKLMLRLLWTAAKNKSTDRKLRACHLCEREIVGYEFDAHQANECVGRTVNCSYCNEEFIYRDLDEHHEVCERKTLDCPNGCGRRIARADMQSHMDVQCKSAEVECPYKCYGCSRILKRRDLGKHAAQFADLHLDLVTKSHQVLGKNYKKMCTFMKEKFDDAPDFDDDICREVIDLVEG